MEVADIKAIVLRADPEAKHYEWKPDGGPYTTWRELRLLDLMADNLHQGGWAFTIDHFTKDEYSEVAERIREALDREPGVAYEYETDYEPDTGCIHHIFTCEGI